jgi:hypothetical protein
MAEGVYLHHRYGAHGGTARIRIGKGVMAERTTQKVMTDKCRYNETRFQGESNELYAEGGEVFSNYRDAYAYTSQAAVGIAADHKGGRSAGKSYIYDTTINAGDGRISREEMHAVVAAYKAEMESRGYQIGGLQYAIHNNGNHTHAHVMYATQRTIQRADDRSLKTVMRTHTEQAKEQDQAKATGIHTPSEQIQERYDHDQHKGR